MIDKAIKLLGISDLPNANDTFTKMVDRKKQGNEQEYLGLLENLVSEMGGGILEETDAINLRKNINLVIETVARGNAKNLSLFETYFQKYVPTSKTISKDIFKFKEPELDVSDILSIKKSEFRFSSDKISQNEHGKLTTTGGLI